MRCGAGGRQRQFGRGPMDGRIRPRRRRAARRTAVHNALALVRSSRRATSAGSRVPNVLYAGAGAVWTSAGVSADSDLLIELVLRRHGAAAAAGIARSIVTPAHRRGTQAQFVPTVRSARPGDLERLQAAVLATPARDWSLAAMASEAGLSARTLARRFATETGQSPITWLVAARLTCAQELLESTGLPVEAVAHAAGFASADLLRKHFRVRYGTNPQAHRLAMRHARATGDRRSDGPPVAEVRWSRATRPDWRRPRPDRTARSRTARSARRSSAAPSVRCPVSASARRHNRAAGRTCPAR